MKGAFLFHPSTDGLTGVLQIGDHLSWNVTDWRDRGRSFTATSIDVWDGRLTAARASLAVSDGEGTLRIGPITYAVTGWRKAGDGVVVFEARDAEWEALEAACAGKVGG